MEGGKAEEGFGRRVTSGGHSVSGLVFSAMNAQTMSGLVDAHLEGSSISSYRPSLRRKALG